MKECIINKKETNKLTEYYIDAVNNSDIIKMQTSPEYANINVITGLPFVLDESQVLEDSQKAAAFLEYVNSLSNELYNSAAKCSVQLPS